MSFSTADYLVDRRKMRRALTLWRVLAFAAALVAILGFGATFTPRGWLNSGKPQVARVLISGIITGDKETLALLADIEKSKAAALIVQIDSPGGTTTGSEKIYDALRRIAAKRPVVGIINNLGASGAYIAALGTDRIYASGNSLVGSIGVLFQFPNVSKLLDTIGVKFEEVKSSPLKAAPNGMEPTSPEARAALAALVTDSFDWFKGLVKERRAMSDDELAKVADGRVFTGRQSLNNKLIDAIGDEKEAIAWMEAERGLTKGLPVREWKKPDKIQNFGLFSLAGSVAGAFGFEGVSATLRRQAEASEAHLLDGLVSIWQIQ